MAIHHERRGSGEPLLLIQGMSGHSLHWGEPFLTDLERDFELITVDNRGTGHSPRVDAPFSIAEMADDAAEVLDELGIESAHVLGISMGGMIGQELVLRHPKKVSTLALGCTYAGGPEGRLASPEVVQVLAEGMQSGDRERAVRAAWGVNVSEAYAADESHYETFVATALAKPVAVQVIMLQMQAIAGHDTSARL